MLDSKLLMKTLLVFGSMKRITSNNNAMVIKQTENTRFSIDCNTDQIIVTFRKLGKTFVFSHNSWKTPLKNKEFDYKDYKMLDCFTSWLLLNINKFKTLERCNVKKLAYKQLIKT